MFYKFEVVNKRYETILVKGKHYNIVTSFVPYKNIIIYPHNKFYLFLLTIYYLSYLLHITLATYLLFIT
jgi:hypothetical protein